MGEGEEGREEDGDMPGSESAKGDDGGGVVR